MRIRRALCGATVAALLLVPSQLYAQIQIVPVVSGLSSPLFVGHAGDGSNRLFVVERGGKIKVLQPGNTSPTTFLDIGTKIVAGGERGLLGLAFHPQYVSNGRFFVFYTAAGTGALTIAEYGVSADRNVANPDSERVVLTIDHPATNHNGGMLAFGPDGYLYVGVGDGGGANDPSNNAQNINVLLGKILRIDVNPLTGYLSPASNPFSSAKSGREEIFAVGFRNPWRFSFDRLTNTQWVADVGQGTREEVDTPIVSGGNYGWRIFEGTVCTNLGPYPCVPSDYRAPLVEYAHSLGRCSITGGYVYRGSRAALTAGTYVYGDFCSGEIFGWFNGAQSVLAATTMSISSFGEDEAGEIYVVDLNGFVGRIAAAAACTYTIAPTSQNFGAAAGTGSITVTAANGCAWTAAPTSKWIRVTSGSTGSGNGTVAYSVDANTSSTSRSGSLTVAGRSFAVNQSATQSCPTSISPVSASFGVGGGTGSFAVTTSAGCGWTAVSNASWIVVTGGTPGTGNGTVTYSVSAFSGKGTVRTGAITVGGRTFAVQQSR